MAEKGCFKDFYISLVVNECVNSMINQIVQNQQPAKKASSRAEQNPDSKSYYSQPQDLKITLEATEQQHDEESDGNERMSQNKTRYSQRRKSRLLKSRMKGTSPILNFLEPKGRKISEQKHFFFQDHTEEWWRKKQKQQQEKKEIAQKQAQQRRPLEFRKAFKKQEENDLKKEEEKKEEEARVSRFTFGIHRERSVILNSFYENPPERDTSKFGEVRKTKSQPKTTERKPLKTPERKMAKDTRQCRTSVIATSKRVTTSLSPISRKLKFRERAKSKIDTGLRRTTNKK